MGSGAMRNVGRCWTINNHLIIKNIFFKDNTLVNKINNTVYREAGLELALVW